MVGNKLKGSSNNYDNGQPEQTSPKIGKIKLDPPSLKNINKLDSQDSYQKHSARLITHNSNGYKAEVQNKVKDTLRLSLRNVSLAHYHRSYHRYIGCS